MEKFNIVCQVRVKWWVKPLVSLIKLWVLVSRKSIDANRLADFVGNHGISKKFVTKEI